MPDAFMSTTYQFISKLFLLLSSVMIDVDKPIRYAVGNN